MSNKKVHSGFTLIELVIVIVILGILAVAALPRFTDLSTDARTASIDGVAGALRSAASIAHATQVAKGYASNISVSLEGVAITMSRGYPVASHISLTLADPILAGYTASNVSTTLENIVWYTITGRTEGTCTVEYKDARADANAGFTVSTTKNGC